MCDCKVGDKCECGMPRTLSKIKRSSTKEAKYRKLLKTLCNLVKNDSNIDDVECGNDMGLIIYSSNSMLEIIKKFERMEKK